MTGTDLTADPAARRVVKRSLPVDVVFAAHAGLLHTLEGEVAYREGDAILTGGRGERWPVARQAFVDSYEPVPPTREGEAGRYRKRPATVLAKRMRGPFSVRVGARAELLTGARGDWLVQYGPGQYGVVSGEIFEETYTALDRLDD